MKVFHLLIAFRINTFVVSAFNVADRHFFHQNVASTATEIEVESQRSEDFEFSNQCGRLCENEDIPVVIKHTKERLRIFIRRLKNFVTLAEFDNEGFELQATGLSTALLEIDDLFAKVAFMENIKQELKFAHRLFNVMLESLGYLKQYSTLGNAADVLVYKIIETKIIALALHHFEPGESIHSKVRISHVNYLLRNVYFLNLLLKELSKFPIDSQLMFEDQATQVEEIIEELAIKITNEM